MANEKRLIDANALVDKFWQEECRTQTRRDFVAMVNYAPTVDAVEVVHGWWKEYIHSALIRFKDGEPVWADRSVFRCCRCYFGTIVRHKYCPNCGAKMDGDGND